MDLDTLTSICEQADIEVTLDNLRSINNAMKETSRNTPFSIPRDAWKLLVKVFGDDMKKYIAARKEEEKKNSPSNETIPISRPNMNVPPILPPKQYNLPTSNSGKPSAQANLTCTNHDDPEGVTADVLDSSESDSDPEVTDEDQAWDAINCDCN